MTKWVNREQSGVSVWSLFGDELPRAEDYPMWRNRARKAAINFDFIAASFRPEDQDMTSHGKIDALDQWVASAQGQDALLRLTRDLQARIRTAENAALPAHDLRQILYKDACEGLRFSEYEEPQGYKSTFLIPMFSHDIGRLLEGKFYHLNIPPQEWIPHSQLSYLMLGEVLDDYPEIPDRLKNHFLYAVLAHSGENGKTYMSRAVQACDRMQMIGPEGFFRAISFMVGLMPEGKIAYPRETQYKSDLPSLWHHKSVISVMEHVGRNMFPNIGERHKEWQDYMLQLNTALLYKMAEQSPELKSYVFAPENNSVPETSLGHFKQKFSQSNIMAAMELANLGRQFSSANTPVTQDMVIASILDAIQKPLGAAQLSSAMEERVGRAVKELNPDELKYIAAGLDFAMKQQRKLDREDDKLITRTRFSHNSSPLAKLVAAEAQTFAHEGVIQTSAVGAVPGTVLRLV